MAAVQILHPGRQLTSWRGDGVGYRRMGAPLHFRFDCSPSGAIFLGKRRRVRPAYEPPTSRLFFATSRYEPNEKTLGSELLSGRLVAARSTKQAARRRLVGGADDDGGDVDATTESPAGVPHVPPTCRLRASYYLLRAATCRPLRVRNRESSDSERSGT